MKRGTRRRRRPAHRAVAATALGVLALTACEGTIATRVDQTRAAASLPAVPRDPLLDAAA